MEIYFLLYFDTSPIYIITDTVKGTLKKLLKDGILLSQGT